MTLRHDPLEEKHDKSLTERYYLTAEQSHSVTKESWDHFQPQRMSHFIQRFQWLSASNWYTISMNTADKIVYFTT